MSMLLGIIGIVLLLPIALTVVAMIVVSLVGGYIAAVVYFFWWVIVAILAVFLFVKLIRKFL